MKWVTRERARVVGGEIGEEFQRRRGHGAVSGDATGIDHVGLQLRWQESSELDALGHSNLGDEVHAELSLSSRDELHATVERRPQDGLGADRVRHPKLFEHPAEMNAARRQLGI